jgi:hypothetical protein
MSKWTIDAPESNQFWEDRRRNESDYQRRQERELAQDLSRLAQAPHLPPAVWRAVERYLNQHYERRVEINGKLCPTLAAGAVGWLKQLSYMSHCLIGELLLIRAGVEVLPLTVRMQYAAQTDPVYLQYAEESRVKWLAWRNRDHEGEWQAVEAKAKLAAGSQPEVLEVPVNDGVQG